MTRIAFAMLLLIVSLFSIPQLNLLDSIINFTTAESTVVSINTDNNIVDANPRMMKSQEGIYKFLNSINAQLGDQLIWFEFLFVSLGGIYIALSMFINKAAPKLFLITICLVFLLTQGAPWDVSELFKGVNSYASLIGRLKLIWEYGSAIHWFVTSFLFGTFYLVTAVLSTAYFFNRKPPKVS